MKPIILIEKDGKVILSKEDLQNIIEDAYEEGKKDGSNSDCNHCYWYLRPYRWSDSPWWKWPQITWTAGTTTTGASTTADSTTATVNPTYTTDTVDYVPLNANTSDSSCTNKCKTTMHWAKNKENK